MRVIYTAGCFDLLHEGHLNVLEASRALGDQLVVGVVTDAGAEAYKRRPIQDQESRIRIVRSLACVDAALLQPGTDPTPVLELLRPDVMTHGGWDRLREGHESLERLGVEWVTLRRTDGISTTAIIERLKGGA